MTVKVSGTGKVNTKVVDTATGDEYVLHLVSGACGEFIGKIRKDYEDVLKTVAECCFDTEVFKSENAKRIIQYIGETRQDRLEFLWEKFPDNAIFRRRDNAKWYAALWLKLLIFVWLRKKLLQQWTANAIFPAGI